jgi:hypothetical protein
MTQLWRWPKGAETWKANVQIIVFHTWRKYMHISYTVWRTKMQNIKKSIFLIYLIISYYLHSNLCFCSLINSTIISIKTSHFLISS